MEIDWEDDVCGIRMIRIRDLFRRLRGCCSFSRCVVQNALKISGSDAAAVVEELLQRGWIERAHQPDGGGSFRLTDNGSSFSIAKAIPRISRAKAERILADFIVRVRELNADDDFGQYVREVHVFGSFLDPSKDRLGDVDLAVDFRDRRIIGRNQRDYECQRKLASGAKGYFFDFLDYEVKRFLRDRDPYIAMEGLCRVEALNTKMQLVYRLPDAEWCLREHRGKPPVAFEKR